MTFIQSPRWAIDLWLVGLRERLVAAYRRASNSDRLETYGRFASFVDRVSPWTPSTGYRRLVLRKALYHLWYPRWYLWRFTTQTALRIVTRLAPYTGPGRFEAMDAAMALKAEWLDAHNEYHTSQAGGGDYPLSQLLFLDLDVPWSTEPESWILEYDEMGFIYASQFENATEARIDHGGFEYRVDAFFAEPGDEVWDPIDHYGTPEHEAWLVEMERQEG
jgi:hypothetical protein